MVSELNQTKPIGWTSHTVNEICNLGRGRVISKKEIENNPGIFPVYSSQTKNNGCLGYIDTYDFEGQYTTWTTDGVYAGSVFYREGKFNCTNVCGTLSPKDPNVLSMNFLSYQLGTQTYNYVVRNGNPKLMNNIMGIIPVLLPPLPEQQKIADILSFVDEVITKTEAIIEQTETVKKGLMQELLTKGIGHTKFKHTEIGEIPEEWEVVTLEDVTSESAFGPRFPSTEYDDDGNYALLRTTDIDSNWNINYNTMPRAVLPKEQFEKHELQIGDLLVTRSGSCGIVVVFNGYSLPVIPGAFLIRFRLMDSILPEFLRLLLMTDKFQHMIEQITAGGVQKNLSGTNLKKLNLVIPSINEQNQITDRISSIERKVYSEKQKLKQLQTLKKGLMQDLLTGKVRVKLDN